MRFYEDRTLILAHRGAREVAPENTMAAFRKALELGADGIELDVMLSADGVPVVIHDSHLERTTDGKGDVADHTAAQLARLDAGSHLGDGFAGERIPTLEEVFSALGDSLLINVELKTQSFRDNGLEQTVADLITAHRLAQSVVYSSFNPASLWRARRTLPSVGRGLLYSRDLPLPLRGAWAAPLLGLQAVHPQHRLVSRSYMAWARRKSYRVNVWTVNEPGDIERCLDLGVDSIITDRPDLALAIRDRRAR